jgi:RHS repeat-associated protein
VVQLTNASGSVTAEYTYDAFGNMTTTQPNDKNPYRYCGEYWDSETRTYYLRARYYSPELGRFTQKDTYRGRYRDPLSLNQYTYSRNNPVIYEDPSGHVSVLSALLNVGTALLMAGAVAAAVIGAAAQAAASAAAVPTAAQANAAASAAKNTTSMTMTRTSNAATMSATSASAIPVRATNEAQGSYVTWSAGTSTGNSTITIFNPIMSVVSTLKEGKEYYIQNGTAYYYAIAAPQPGNVPKSTTTLPVLAFVNGLNFPAEIHKAVQDNVIASNADLRLQKEQTIRYPGGGIGIADLLSQNISEDGARAIWEVKPTTQIAKGYAQLQGYLTGTLLQGGGAVTTGGYIPQNTFLYISPYTTNMYTVAYSYYGGGVIGYAYYLQEKPKVPNIAPEPAEEKENAYQMPSAEELRERAGEVGRALDNALREGFAVPDTGDDTPAWVAFLLDLFGAW